MTTTDVTLSPAAAKRIQDIGAREGRPMMLRALLQSWLRLEFPAGVTPLFIVVENDTANLNEASVDDFRACLRAGETLYRLESEIGIPNARNAAVAAALSRDAVFICFVDDDETVAPDWFIQRASAGSPATSRRWYRESG